MKATSMLFVVSLHIMIARSTSPESYAAIALFQVLLAIGIMLSDFGNETRHIREGWQQAEATMSTFTWSLRISLLLAAVFVIWGGLFESIFDFEGLGHLLRFGAVALPLAAVQLLPRADLMRRQEFNTVAVNDALGSGIGWIPALVALHFFDGLTALIIFVLLMHASRAVLHWRASALSVNVVFRLKAKFSSFAKGGVLFSIAALNFIEIHFDDLIVAANLGGAALSVYQLSYYVIMLQQDFISGVMKRIAYPVYAEKARRGVAHVLRQLSFDTRFVVAVSVPFLLMCILAAEPMVVTLLNEAWRPAVPVFQLLCLEALRQSLFSLAAPALVALGEEGRLLKYARASSVVLLPSFILLSFTDIVTFTIGFVFVNTLLNWYYYTIVRDAFAVPIRMLFLSWLPALLASIVVAVVYGILYPTGARTVTLFLIVASCVAGLVTYASSGEIRTALRLLLSRTGMRRGHTASEALVHSDSAFDEYNPHLKMLHERIESDVPELRFTSLHFRSLILSLPRRMACLLSGKRRQRSEIVHMHFPAFIYASPNHFASCFRAAKYLCMMACFTLAGMRLFVTFHDERAHDFTRSRFEYIVLLLLITMADRVLTLSKTASGILETRFGRSSGVSMTPHPVYTGAYPDELCRDTARHRLNIDENERVLLMFGNNKAYKGYGDAIACLSTFQDTHCTLLCVGTGMSSLATDTLPSNITCIVVDGHIPIEDVQLYMRASDYALLPYRSILHSGSAMLCATFELPIIAPRMGVFNDIASMYDIGLMYSVEKHCGMLDALRIALGTSPRAFAAELRRFKEHHSLRSASEATVEAYAHYVHIDGGKPSRTSEALSESK